MEVYCRKQPEGQYPISNSAKDTALRECISQSGRGVKADNYFCSISLALITRAHQSHVINCWDSEEKEIRTSKHFNE